ncbi:helix-turn-helix domain-containing protein [Salisediminibacterium beveridgei]|uniref:Transcriptional Regulator CdaR n=1 Tax=Salisediminibacterium beveridgei TaxID=632773 RepID=A0A1D7QS12_9BACI|nr:GAF domain-containing protein [Salisediminibacterium beveridgei]AOM81781.1 Transcriptional Regulator CdaR [Salisediminibacterium beveridgei]
MSTEKKLLSLINAARVLTSTLDLDEVLTNLIQEVLNVIDGANASVLFLYDEKAGTLYAKAAVGFDMTHLQHARLAPGEGLSGSTFKAQKGQIFRSSDETTRQMANIPPAMKEVYGRSLGVYMVPASALSVPLFSKGKVIGVLTVDIYEKDAAFDDENLQLLETFAAQAAVAIDNATMFSQNQRTNRIHEELSQAALTRGGIGEITRRLADILQLGVVAFNDFFDLLDGSHPTVIASANQFLQSRRENLRHYVSPETVSSLFGKSNDRSVEGVFFPLRSEERTVGYVMIFLEEDESIDPLDRFAIEQTSVIFTMELNRRVRDTLNDWRHSSAMLDQIIHGEWNTQVIANLEALPVFAKIPLRMIVLHLHLETTHLRFNQVLQEKEDILRLIYRRVSHHPCQSYILDDSTAITILFVIPQHLDAGNAYDELRGLFDTVAKEAGRYHQLPVMIGIGRIVHQVSQLRTGYRDAVKAVELIQKSKTDRRIVTYDELGVERLLLSTEWSELAEFVESSIGPIIHYDTKNSASLVETLTVYLENNQNMATTAKALFVHVNTVKYRLGLIKDLLGMEFIKGRHAFELQLGIYIHQYLHQQRKP